MTETVQRLSVPKPPKHVHFVSKPHFLDVTRQHDTSPTPVKSTRIKSNSRSPPPNIPSRFSKARPLFAFSTNKRNTADSQAQPLKSAMKTTVQPKVFPQQLDEQPNKIRKPFIEYEEITPIAFSRQQSDSIDGDKEIESTMGRIMEPSKRIQEFGKDQLKNLTIPSLSSAEQRNLRSKRVKSVKNSLEATSSAIKHKSPVRKGEDGITPKLIKKVAALKPLIDNAILSTTEAAKPSKSRKNREKQQPASKKKEEVLSPAGRRTRN